MTPDCSETMGGLGRHKTKSLRKSLRKSLAEERAMQDKDLVRNLVRNLGKRRCRRATALPLEPVKGRKTVGPCARRRERILG